LLYQIILPARIRTCKEKSLYKKKLQPNMPHDKKQLFMTEEGNAVFSPWIHGRQNSVMDSIEAVKNRLLNSISGQNQKTVQRIVLSIETLHIFPENNPNPECTDLSQPVATDSMIKISTIPVHA